MYVRAIIGRFCKWTGVAHCGEVIVGVERVEPNEGSFCGGWVTANATSPFTGGPNSALW